MYQLAEEFYRKNGHLHIKQIYVKESGAKLGIWIYVQRQRYRSKGFKILPDEKISLLDQIQMIW